MLPKVVLLLSTMPLFSSNRNSEVAGHVAPDAVNVVGGIAGRVGLRIDELDEERRALDAVVMADARLQRARPSETHVLRSVFNDATNPLPGNALRHTGDVFVHQVFDRLLLVVTQIGECDADFFVLGRLRIAGGANFPRGLCSDDGCLFLLVAK